MFGLKSWRLQRLRAAPFPDAWERCLGENARFFARIAAEDQARLRDLVKVFVAEKRWEGCGGLEITDPMRVTVAAHACLLLLGAGGDYYFDRVKTILLYPGAYAHPPAWHHGAEVEVHGEAWYRGPVVLSWDHALAGGREEDGGRNVVVHEFAHQLDALDGEIGGTPPLRGDEAYRRWSRVVGKEFAGLQHSARRSEPTLLDPYGATNRAEFFAVASECFFGRSREMRASLAELYGVLGDFYSQNPAGDWRW